MDSTQTAHHADPRQVRGRSLKGQQVRFKLDGKQKTGKVVEADWWLVVRVDGENEIVYVDPMDAEPTV